MSAWDAYPEDYRADEVQAILTALRAGECVSLVGLSGAGKSNLTGFLYYRRNSGRPGFILIDGNRAQLRTAQGLFRAMRGALGDSADAPGEDFSALERAVDQKLAETPGGLCLLLDRYDALSEEERRAAAGPLRALRDAHKYRLTYLTATRRPLDPADELAELFYANTLWLGPLSPPNARWSAGQYAERRGQVWRAETVEALIDASWGYPSLLRACCEAHAAGCPPVLADLRAHPAVQRRAQEFWSDSPAPEDLKRSGLEGLPLLGQSHAPVSAESPDLTASEHRLLAYFQAHAGEVCAKDDLIRAVWPQERVVEGLRDDSLAQLIRRLRQKIGADAVQTIPGRGYRYAAL